MSKNFKDLHFKNDRQFMNFLVSAMSDDIRYNCYGDIHLGLSDLDHLADYVEELKKDSKFVVSDLLRRVLKAYDNIVNSDDLPYFIKLIVKLDNRTIMVVKERKRDPIIDMLLKSGAVVLSLDDLPDENKYPDLATFPDEEDL